MTTIKSIKEKAKAYDEALERANEMIKAMSNIGGVAKVDDIQHIFPELKESEDERMIQYFKDLAPFDKADELYEKYGFSHKDAIAWLEKQGKQKETLCDKCKKKQPSHSCQDITALGRCALEKQGEQKLTEFEKAVKQVMEEAIECGDTHNLKADAEMLLSLVHKSADKVKPRYSTGDVVCDKLCTTLNKDAQPNLEIVNIEDGVYICDKGSFPISQQDNYELVSKKIGHNSSWSEEDDIMKQNCHQMLALLRPNSSELIKDIIDNCHHWLKSLKGRVQPQSTWKPSDEQVKAVKEAACYSSVFSEKTIDNLISLSKQLKTLREE